MTITNNGSFFAFIPLHLEIKDRPELNIFPFNVFVSTHRINMAEKIVVWSIFYDPDLSSYEDNGTVKSLTYLNVFNSDFKLKISIDTEKNTYSCDKYDKEKIVGAADGAEWNRFFIQVGLLGFADKETYMFDELNQTG